MCNLFGVVLLDRSMVNGRRGLGICAILAICQTYLVYQYYLGLLYV